MPREPGEPVYYISVAARLVNTHPQTLRMYERLGLIQPLRSGTNLRLYSEQDIQRVRRIQHLTQDLGVNLAGVEVVFHLLDKMEEMRADMERELEQMRQQVTEMTRESNQSRRGSNAIR